MSVMAWKHGGRSCTAIIAMIVLAIMTSSCSGMPGVESSHNSSLKAPSASLPRRDEPSRDDLRDEHTASWHRYDILNDTTIRMYYSGETGLTDCYGFRTEVQENTTSVNVKLIIGQLPHPPRECSDRGDNQRSMVGRVYSLLVHTKQPIRSRSIIPVAP